MSNYYDQSGLFNALRQLLKNRGLVYRDLATMLKVSEPTIKRLFHEQDCKLSRILEICDLLDIEFAELLKISQDAQRQRGTVLPNEVEQHLARNKNLAAFFMLLISHFDVEQIAQSNQLSDSDVYRYLRELEKLQLLTLSANNHVQLTVERPIRWRLNGPLNNTLITVNQSFVREAIEGYQPEQYPFFSSSRLLGEQSIEELNQQLKLLYEQFQYRATLDQSFYPADQLKPYKLLTTLKPFNLAQYFPVAKWE